MTPPCQHCSELEGNLLRVRVRSEAFKLRVRAIAEHMSRELEAGAVPNALDHFLGELEAALASEAP
jgi:hypothetical protein